MFFPALLIMNHVVHGRLCNRVHERPNKTHRGIAHWTVVAAFDLLGKTVWEVRAPLSGVILYVCGVPSRKKGETVANIGVVAGKAP